MLRADNGPEFIAAAVGRWASEHDTLQAFIPPGQPWHNGFVESLHNRMRDELLEDNMFEDLNHARSSPVEWCNRFVSFGLGYALSWSGVSSCWVGCGVSRDLVRMSRLR